MPKKPTSVLFVCETCGKSAKPGKVRRWQGWCRRCDGRRWALLAEYTETERNFSLLGILTSLVPGGGLYSVRVATNQVTVRGVSDEVARHLTRDRWQVKAQVAEYLRRQQGAYLRAKGGQTCRACDGLFVPSEDKPWTTLGYCSKACCVEAGATIESMFEETPAEPRGGRTIRITCPCGRAFDVHATYSGCTRRCPECGEKCAVP
jgi:hypothetical protein